MQITIEAFDVIHSFLAGLQYGVDFVVPKVVTDHFFKNDTLSERLRDHMGT